MSNKRSHGNVRTDKMRDHEIRNAFGRREKNEMRSMNIGLDNLARELGVRFNGETTA